MMILPFDLDAYRTWDTVLELPTIFVVLAVHDMTRVMLNFINARYKINI